MRTPVSHTKRGNLRRSLYSTAIQQLLAFYPDPDCRILFHHQDGGGALRWTGESRYKGAMYGGFYTSLRSLFLKSRAERKIPIPSISLWVSVLFLEILLGNRGSLTRAKCLLNAYVVSRRGIRDYRRRVISVLLPLRSANPASSALRAVSGRRPPPRSHRSPSGRSGARRGRSRCATAAATGKWTPCRTR